MKSSQVRRPNGFSLVASLVLMVMLSILAIGLLSLSSISLHGSQFGTADAAAKANARLALQLALGELQKFVGPDQRVTASAEILGATGNRKWTGVWSTTDPNGGSPDPTKPVVSGHTNANYLSDQRSTDSTLSGGAWKSSMRLGWLVSGEDPDLNSNDGLTLVGQGSLGDQAPAEDQVTAPVVAVSAAGPSSLSGSYAYWVGDESQKARIDQASPHKDRSPNLASAGDGGYYRLLGDEGPVFASVQAAGSAPYAAIDALSYAERTRLISREMVSVAVDNTESVRSNFHDITADSSSVLVDVQAGGLKKDLTAFLESSNGVPSVSGIADTELAQDAPILPGTKYQTMGPKFSQLRNWYRLKDEISGRLGNAEITPQYLSSRSVAEGEYKMFEGNAGDMTTGEQPVHPILVNFRMAFDFSLDRTHATGRGLLLHVYPRVTLWNPYNVTLKGQRYVAACSFPELSNFKVGGVVASGGSYGGFGFQNMIYFTLAAIDMEPGECLVFSPDMSSSTGVQKSGNSALYNANTVSANVLSAEVPTGVNSFYIETGRTIDAQVDLSGNQPIRYGFDGVNDSIRSGQGYFLKRATNGGNISRSAVQNSANFPTISSMLMDYNGKKTSWWWDVFYLDNEAVNGGAIGLRTHEENPGRFPPRRWYVEGRLRWLDESDELAALGHWGGGAGSMYQNPVIGHFNIRANATFRNQFDFYDDWTKYAPGATMIPWSSPRLGDTRVSYPWKNGKSTASPFGLPGDWSGVDSYALFDLPHQDVPLFSLASFQHAQLGYQGWQPTYVVGHSLAEPRADRNLSVHARYFSASDPWDGSFAKHTPGSWNDLVQGTNSGRSAQLLIHDVTYGVNARLWDRYFLSTLPYSSGTVQWKPGDTLPNSRLVLHRTGGQSDQEIESLMRGTQPFSYSAYFLMNEGAFNVNSTSVEAWKAFLSTLSRVERPTADGGSITNAFSRLLVPPTDSSPAGTRVNGTWNGARALSEQEIENLANAMVQIVKERGPFVSLADFVNRRLGTAASTAGFDDETFCGPLQAAIENAGLNASLQSSDDATRRDTTSSANSGGGMYKPDANAYYPWKTYGAPGYLSQADVLQTIGANLTVRGDTFVIRAYGDAKDANGTILSRAWCEAVVQRMPDYLLSSPVNAPSDSNGNNPLEPVTIASSTSFALSENGNLLPVNRTFGRKLVVRTFRWLNSNEV